MRELSEWPADPPLHRRRAHVSFDELQWRNRQISDLSPCRRYLLFNLGMSESESTTISSHAPRRADAHSPADFGYVDLDHLVFPSVMRVDYVRVYQDSDLINSEPSPRLLAEHR